MGRTTVYHEIVTEEKWNSVNEENKKLLKEFVNYLKSANKSPATIKQYEAQLRTFFVFVCDECENKFFVNLKKRDYVKYFGYLANELEVSPNRVSSLRAVISSLSNFIERILDEEYPTFRNIVKILEPVQKVAVREKTVLDEEQIQKCLDALVADRKYQVACALALLASSGMRKSELIQMKVEYFNDEHLIFNGAAWETDKIRTKGRGKIGKVISRIVFRGVIDFEKYLNLWMEERQKNGINNEWLFIVYNDGNYERAEISTANSFARTITAYMGEPVYLHCLRHYFTTTLLRKGFSATDVQKIVEWASADMVKTYDDRSSKEELEEIMAKIQSQDAINKA